MKAIDDFFNKLPGIVDMDMERGKPVIESDDKIVRVEYDKKSSYNFFTVYYLHRIYNDDRIYKCKARFKVLPEIVKRWINDRTPKENGYWIRWEVDQ